MPRLDNRTKSSLGDSVASGVSQKKGVKWDEEEKATVAKTRHT
jgi:hypothetical protein